MALFSKNKNDAPTETVGFMHHLEALRWHLVRAAAAILFFSVFFFINKEFLFDDIIFAPRNPDFWTYRALCDFSHWLHLGEALCISIQEIKIINTDLSGQFTMHMWAALVAGLVLGFPYLAWEMWRFIKPALYDKEIKNTRGVVLAVSILFVVGVLFGYYIIVPLSLNFLATYQITTAVQNYISMDSFISNVTTVALMSGVVFELPVVVYFLSLLGIMSPSFMRNYRRHAVVVILIVAAIITPSPDVTSQMLVAIPLYVLYEASIFVSMYVEKEKAKKAMLL
ncbi:MAG: twin-arginine translocase subunit TatC [Bacteroidia bacterium]|nr:twin-arginine translocase subunit TatC [Bacteroidia bacterium]